MSQRIKGTAIVFFILILVLSVRLYYIQVICSDELSAGAEGQQMIPVVSDFDRGTIYDRNMLKLTNDTCEYYYLIHRENYTVGLEKLMNSISGEIAGKKGEDYLVYRTTSFQPDVNALLVEQYDAYGFCIGSRYADNQVAAHLIGYMNESDGTGVSGLEKYYNARLSSVTSSFSLTGSGIGEPMDGLGIEVEESVESLTPSALITTIDKPLQTKIEEILKEGELTGAVVVLDVQTGQVLSMASSPTFNPNNTAEYLQSDQSELVNKAVQGLYPPGSVFKIVVAAAALESEEIDLSETYTCKGSIKINGVELICEGHEKGHGKLDFHQAFAKSCNCYFAKLGEKIGAEDIIEMAERLGFGEAVLDDFPGEETGVFPSEKERSYSGLSNLSIGQGSLLVTPLQVARMTNIIARGGMKMDISLVMGTAMVKEDADEVILSQETVSIIQDMMQLVIEEGTASGIEIAVDSAGKTGSAESSSAGSDVVHGWFTGYFPADKPKYTVTVLIENGKTGSGSALPVFQQIADYLYGYK